MLPLGLVAAWSYLGQWADGGDQGGWGTGMGVPVLPCIYPGQPWHSPTCTWVALGVGAEQGAGCPREELPAGS